MTAESRCTASGGRADRRAVAAGRHRLGLDQGGRGRRAPGPMAHRGHAAQPSAWGEDELVAALAGRLAPGGGSAAWPSASPTLLRRRTAHRRATPRAGPAASRWRPSRRSFPARRRVGRRSRPAGSSSRRSRPMTGARWSSAPGGAAVRRGRRVADGRRLRRGGGDRALEMAGLVAAARGGGRSPVVWAGAAGLTGRGVGASSRPGPCAAVANPRPSADRENLLPLRRYLEG